MAKKEIAQLRKEAGLTQKQLQQKTGLGIMTIYRLENDADSLQAISYKNLVKVARALNVQPWDIEMHDEEQLDNDEFDPIGHG